MTEYLERVERAFLRWHEIDMEVNTDPERVEQLEVLAAIKAHADALFALDVQAYDAIPPTVSLVISQMAVQVPDEIWALEERPDYWKALHDVAGKEHETDRAKLRQWVEAGLNHPSDRRLRNSCQWVCTEPRRVRLFLLTETGDRHHRLVAARRNPDTAAAFFPSLKDPACWDLFDDPVPAQVYDYNSLTDPNVLLESGAHNARGWNWTGAHIVVTHTAVELGRDFIWELLRHEVQHDADYHKQGVDIERYKSEYRAYSYQGTPAYDALDNTVSSIIEKDPKDPSITYLFTARQHAIFSQIMKEYDYARLGWQLNFKVAGGRTFREAVIDYVDPDTEAVNRFNSPRLDQLYRLAAKVTADGNAGDSGFQTLIANCFDGGAMMLDRDDILETLKPGSAMRAHLERYLKGAARMEFRKRCEARLRVPTTFHVRNTPSPIPMSTC